MHKKKRCTFPLGTLSTGTLRSKELVSCFSDALKTIAGTGNLRRHCNSVLGRGDEHELSMFLDDVLFPAMEDLTPPYAWFGMSEGDNADIGYWAAIDKLREDACSRNGVISRNAGETWSGIPRDISYVMEINDHGNVSLRHRANGREIWSLV